MSACGSEKIQQWVVSDDKAAGALKAACRSAQSLEALENYATADDPLVRHRHEDVESRDASQYLYVWADEVLWNQAFAVDDQSWGRRIQFGTCYVSEWIARVPGLYWKPKSIALRQISAANIEEQSHEWITYDPPGKSQKVLGGVGTIRMPPDSQGFRLISLTCGLNASSGIPALATPDVWNLLQADGAKADGRRLEGCEARWQAMSTTWADRFPSIRGIPKGYVVLDNLQRSNIHNERGPVQFHPFTVMEYERDGTILHDFVYSSADLGEPDWRGSIERFFETYKEGNGRYGKYLLSADLANPLWDADNASPAELRDNLELITARVHERTNGANTIDALLNLLSHIVQDQKELIRISDELKVPLASWLTTGTIAAQIEAFVITLSHRAGKLDELLYKLAVENPELLKS